MKSSNKRGWTIRSVARNVILFALALIIAGSAWTPVVADDRDHRDGDRRGHYDRDRHRPPERHGRYYWHGRYYDYPPPGYYAPPPPVVQAPPPPPPGITFVFPLHFR